MLTGRTHLALGLAAGVGIAAWTAEQESDVAYVAAAAIAALLPDIDEENSTINRLLLRWVPPPFRRAIWAGIGILLIVLFFRYSLPLWVPILGGSIVIFSLTPHRGITHSLFALVLVSGLTYWAADFNWALAVAAGYMTHLLADSMTASGIPLFWPGPERYGFVLGIRVKVGGMVDTLIGVTAFILAWAGWVYLR